MKALKRIMVMALGLSLVTAALVDCKKYPDDRFISFRKPSARLAGKWKITHYNFNNNSIIGLLNAKTATFDIRDLVLDISKKTHKTPQYYQFDPHSDLNVDGYDNPLSDNNATFEFHGGSSGSGYGDSLLNYIFITPLSFKGQDKAIWDIRNLYLGKFHLQLKTDSGSYDLFFEK